MQTTRRLVLGASASLALPRLARAADTLSVKTDFLPWGVHAGLHLAVVKGWFKDANLDVDVQDGRGSANTLQLVNAGQVDVGQIQVGLIAQANAAGAKTRAFAGLMRATDLAVLVPNDSPIKTVADFKGKSLVVFAASPWAPFVDLWLKAGGLTRETATIMFVDPSALFGTYTSGRADGLMSPVATALPIAAKGRPSRAIYARDAGVNFPSYGLVATDAILASKKEALRRLVRVQQQAWTHLKSHPEDGVAAMQSQRPDARLDPAIIEAQIKLCLSLFDTPATAGKPIGWQAEADWDAGIATLVAAGAVKPGLKATDFFTNDLVT